MGKKHYKGRRAEAFIFDLDGTLVDSGLDIALAANFTRGHFDLKELSVDTINCYVGDGVARLLTRALGHDIRTGMTGVAGLPVSPQMLQEGQAVFGEYYGRHLLDNTVAYPGVLDMLVRFRRFPLHLATNKPRKFTDAILAGLHLDGAFRRIVAGDEAPVRKPDPSHLRACLEGLDLEPGSVVVVGDSPNDIHAARAMGAVAVGCTYGLVAPGLVRSAKPDLVIDSVEELSRLFPSRAD